MAANICRTKNQITIIKYLKFMAWQTDRSVIDYLERRVKYYKKKISKIKSILTDDRHERYRKEKGISAVKKAVKIRVAHYEERIIEYNNAINQLKNPPTHLQV